MKKITLILIILIFQKVKNQDEKSEKQIKMDACIKIVQLKLSKEMEYFREISKLMKNKEMKEEESFNHLFTLVLLSCYSQITYFDAEEIDLSSKKIDLENEQISKLINLEKWENLFRENNQENIQIEIAQLNEAYLDIQNKEVNLDLLRKNRMNNIEDNKSNNEKDERMDSIYMRNREDNLDFNIFGFNFTKLSDKYRYFIGCLLIAFVFLSVIYGLKWINDIRNEGKSLKKKKKKN
jgi:hypothetical protein